MSDIIIRLKGSQAETLSHDDIVDLLTGCTIMGTGGGNLEAGMNYIDCALTAGKTLNNT